MSKYILIIFMILLTACDSKPAPDTIAAAEGFKDFSIQAEKSGLSKKSITKIGRMKVNQEVLHKISHPAEAKSWEWYKNLLLTPTRINKGKAFTKQFPQTLDQAQNIYGVPSEYIASILGVETMYGERKGQFLVPEALATIGFYYPKRSKFFLYELDSLLQLEKNTHINIFSLKGSYAGAFGMGQFMPDSYQDYAISHKNKAPDLMHSFDDNILSIANFLSKKGKWQKDQPCLKPIFNSQPNPVAAQLMKNQHTRWLGKNDPKFKAFYPEGTMENVTGVLVVRETKDSYSTWLTYPNYHAIKTYNISDMYALLVHLLAEEVHG